MAEVDENAEVQEARLQRLLQGVSRQELRQLLSREISKSRRCLSSLSLQEDRLQTEEPARARRPAKQPFVPSVKPAKNSRKNDQNSIVRITSYKHEQSDKFMKLYVPVPELKPADNARFKCRFVPKGVAFTLTKHRGRRHEFVLDNLTEEIDPESSNYRVKEGVVVLFLWKRAQGLSWRTVSTREGHQLKHLVEYNIFRAEVAAITSSCLSPTGEIDLQRVLHKKGYYTITATTSFTETEANFKKWPPKVIVLESSRTRVNPSTNQRDTECSGEMDSDSPERRETDCSVEKDTECHRQRDSDCPQLRERECSLQRVTELRENFIQVLSLVGEDSRDVLVLIRNLDTFLNPTDYAMDAAQLDALAQKRVILTGFWGYLSPRDMGRLPHKMTELGLAIANSADAAAVASMTPPRGLNLLALSVSCGVDPESLAPVPGPGLLQLHLYFCDLRLDSLTWMLRCLQKLTAFGSDQAGLCSHKMHWLYLQRCQLKALELAFMCMLMKFDCLLGVQLDAPHLQEVDRHMLQQMYRENNCQLLMIGAGGDRIMEESRKEHVEEKILG